MDFAIELIEQRKMAPTFKKLPKPFTVQEALNQIFDSDDSETEFSDAHLDSSSDSEASPIAASNSTE